VFVHRTVNNSVEAVMHCSLDLTTTRRLLQIPQWMFDAAAMCGVRLTSTPIVDSESLQELKVLLSATIADGVVQVRQPSVDDAGDNHAKLIEATAAGTAAAFSSGRNNAELGQVTVEVRHRVLPLLACLLREAARLDRRADPVGGRGDE
jgi:hypothetical protein